ncbi:hypothetical protein F5Y07DRAFT_17509 [Xylaria sp. FL0933]|nr:hypothetical protein F5Y07DRAFT_17509 [Xylaria sp. FL0933]
MPLHSCFRAIYIPKILPAPHHRHALSRLSMRPVCKLGCAVAMCSSVLHSPSIALIDSLVLVRFYWPVAVWGETAYTALTFLPVSCPCFSALCLFDDSSPGFSSGGCGMLRFIITSRPLSIYLGQDSMHAATGIDQRRASTLYAYMGDLAGPFYVQPQLTGQTYHTARLPHLVLGTAGAQPKSLG